MSDFGQYVIFFWPIMTLIMVFLAENESYGLKLSIKTIICLFQLLFKLIHSPSNNRDRDTELVTDGLFKHENRPI